MGLAGDLPPGWRGRPKIAGCRVILQDIGNVSQAVNAHNPASLRSKFFRESGKFGKGRNPVVNQL